MRPHAPKYRLFFGQEKEGATRDRPRESDGDAGFSTVEALVAFFILALILGGTIQLIATSTRQLTASSLVDLKREELKQVQLEFQSKLLLSLATDNGPQSKTANGWRMSFTPLPRPKTAGNQYRLVHIEISRDTQATGTSSKKVERYSSFRLVTNTGREQ